MIRGHSTYKLCIVLSATVEGCVDGYSLFSDDSHFNLRSTFLVSSTRSSTKNGRFAENKLKAAQEDGVEAVSFNGRVDGYPIARTVARLATLNDKGDTILNNVTSLWLRIDGPCRVKFMFVDDDLRSGRNDGGLVTSEKPSWNPG